MHNNGILAGHNMIITNSEVSNTVSTAQGQARRNRVDVLVVTALKEEYDAVRAVAGTAREREYGGSGPAPYSIINYRAGGGAPLAVALARPTRMGGRGTGPIATTLTDQLRPTCLAMSGVCAGNPSDTVPGDVVVASPAYEWDEGKHTGGVFRADHQQFPLDARWIRAVQDFDPSGLPSHGVATDEEATVWYLERLYRGQDPRTHPARRRYFPHATWQTRLGRLESDGLITWRDARWALTDSGRDCIERLLYDDVDGPERLPFAVFPGPMASGSAVMSEPGIWDQLEVSQRKILALEMEAATIATIAHERQVPHWLVAKGVMDHANLDKDDRFKAFAARASAEVLFALAGNLLTSTAAPERPEPAGDRVVPDQVRLEVISRLTYDWQDLAETVGVPSQEIRRFRAGAEPHELWDWMVDRHRLEDLPGALTEIGRGDLSALLRPHLG